MMHLWLTDPGGITFASAGQYAAKGPFQHPRRQLETHVLLLGCSGACPISVDGREYLLREKSFLLLPAGVEHWGVKPVDPSLSYFWCHFSASASLTEQPREGLCLPEFGTLPQAERYLILFRQLIDAAWRQDTYPEPRQQICSHYCAILLTELSEEARRQRQGLSGEKGRLLVSRVEEWIRQHACEGMGAGDAAAHFRYSGDYLSQLMRAYTGHSLERCILRHRLLEARHLLLETDLPVHEIAGRTGFSDSKYFMRVFRRWENMTPTQYRESCRHIHVNSK